MACGYHAISKVLHPLRAVYNVRVCDVSIWKTQDVNSLWYLNLAIINSKLGMEAVDIFNAFELHI